MTNDLPLIPRVLLDRKIRSLERKLRGKEKEIERLKSQRREYLAFVYAFRKFLNRFENRKWDSQFPIQRLDEAMIHLRELLP